MFARAFLAGGITAENAAQRIQTYQPFGIDVASGVEAEPGIKDVTKLKDLFSLVRQFDEERENA